MEDNLPQSALAPAHPVAAETGLAVVRLRLGEFRSYETLDLALGPESVVLTGPNGAGKTNLLEALSFLAPGRGLRRARLGDVGRWQAEAGWSVFAEIAAGGQRRRLGTGLAEDGGRSRRVARIDGEGATPAAFSELLSVQWLTPAMDRLFVDAPSGRRRFLDRLVFGQDPAHARRVAAYERAQRERARLLRRGGGDPVWLATLEARLAAEGVAIAVARQLCVAALGRALGITGGPFPAARLAITGDLENLLASLPALEVEQRMAGALASGRRAEADGMAAALGPHRSDLEVVHGDSGTPAAACSTGEQKALLISIVLANARLDAARRGRPPILLLDEIVAHLDGVRRAALFAELEALGAQAWMTGTDRALFGAMPAATRFLEIAPGSTVSEEQ